MGFTHPKSVKAMAGFLQQPKTNKQPNSGKKGLKPTSTIVPRKTGKSTQPTSTVVPRRGR